MSPLEYVLAAKDGDASLTITISGKGMKSTTSSHPDYKEILERTMAGDESVFDLMDAAEVAANKFSRLSERVAIKGGLLYFDGDPIDNDLTRVIATHVRQNVEDWKPLVRFLEKVMTNPNEHSREQLYGFVGRNEISITNNGDLVMYKGVYRDEDDPGVYRPSQAGHGIVDGIEYHNAKLPQRIGSAVEIPRSEVVHDPSSACHTGLHAATFEFARRFALGLVLEIHVNPRDVVSVPNAADKVRISRYVVIREVTESYTSVVIPDDTARQIVQDYENERCDDCEEYMEDCVCCGECGYDDCECENEPEEDEPEKIEGKIPSAAKFKDMATTAKSQKKGFSALAQRRGWVFIGGDTDNRNNWRIVS